VSRPSWETYASDPIATIRAVAAGIDFATAWTRNPTITMSPAAAAWFTRPRCHRLAAVLYQAAIR
jgi:hypothetical protein